jgi:hypothetical protein
MERTGCVRNDSILKKPLVMDFSNPQKNTPFTLYGAPLSNRPQSLMNRSEYRRKAGALTNTEVAGYLGDTNYYMINDNTKHIIGADANTTLRYEGISYTQKFIAIHKPIWGEDVAAHLSIFFTSGDNDMFHICIPVKNSSTDENVFLKMWLHTTESLQVPGGFTTNELLNFKGLSRDNVSYATIHYCLSYNGNKTVNPYTVCIFQDAINLDFSKCEDWIKSITTPSTYPSETEASAGKTYFRNTFDKIFNFMMSNKLYFYNRTLIESKLISEETHINDAGDMQDAVKAIFYNSKISIISKQPFSPKAPRDAKKLGNVKCYPIDLVNQIDEAGNIFIDQDTNKPIDIKAVTNPEETYNMDLSAIENERIKQKQNENYVKYIIVFTIVIVFLIGLIVAVFIWASGSSSSTGASASSTGASASSTGASTAVEVVSTIATILGATRSRRATSFTEASPAASAPSERNRANSVISVNEDARIAANA